MAGIVFYECERAHCQLSFLDLLTLLSVLGRAMYFMNASERTAG